MPAPKQRNTEAEKKAIKEGLIREGWTSAKARQKDRDALWSVKYTRAKVKKGADPKAAKPIDLAIPTFGCKNYIGIARARIRIGMANLVYNFQCLAWLEGRIIVPV